jgi:hypothetical protein
LVERPVAFIAFRMRPLSITILVRIIPPGPHVYDE